MKTSPIASFLSRHFGGNLLVAVLMAGAITASVITLASGPANTMRVFVQYEGPGLGNYEHPIPGATVRVSPSCDQESVVTDENGLAFFSGCDLSAPDLTTTVISYPGNYRPLECPAGEPLCQPTHAAETLADHPGEDIFVFIRLDAEPEPLPSSPSPDYDHTYPTATPPVVGGTLRGNRPSPAPVAIVTPSLGVPSPTPSPVASEAPYSTAIPSPSPEAVAANDSVSVASLGSKVTAGLVAILLLMILAAIFIGRALLHHLRR